MRRILTAVIILVAACNIAFAQNVTFKVNMSKQIYLNKFKPLTDSLYVKGSFNGWAGTNPIPKPAGTDSIWSVTVNAAGAVGDTIFYKYMFHTYQLTGSDVWENDPNRTFKLVAGTSVLDPVYFNNEKYAATKVLQLQFKCNMELERLSGRFRPALDTLSVNGSFNGWASKVNILAPTSNADIYAAVVPVEVMVGDILQFKFWYTPNNWESIDNRTFTITQAIFDAGSAVAANGNFNNGSLANVIAKACVVKFTVQTTGAKDGNGIPFPSVSNVVICGSSAPLGWPGGGWPTSDSAVTVRLYDNGTNGDLVANDKIFSRDITFPAYTPLGVNYKYGINFGLATNGGANDNEGGVGTNHTLPWQTHFQRTQVVDTFGVIKVANLINAIKDVNGAMPSNFSLSQNFPNPFNPSTMISFSIPSSEFVTVSMFNVLGQEVAQLVNEQKNAGSYQITFDASKLTSGTYFYTIKAGHWTETKKMVLLK